MDWEGLEPAEVVVVEVEVVDLGVWRGCGVRFGGMMELSCCRCSWCCSGLLWWW